MSEQNMQSTVALEDQETSSGSALEDAIAIDEQDSETVVQEEDTIASSDLIDLLQQIDQLEADEESMPEDLTSEPQEASEDADTRGARPSKTAVAMLNAVNRIRRKYGRSALRLDARLTAAAQSHSKDMARRKRIGHTGSDGSSPSDRSRRYGYPGGAGENVAAGQKTVKAVMTAWMNSPGHRKNILNSKYKALGVGYANNGQWYWTQVFGLR